VRHEPGYEVNVAAQTVELRHGGGASLPARVVESRAELGSAVMGCNGKEIAVGPTDTNDTRSSRSPMSSSAPNP